MTKRRAITYAIKAEMRVFLALGFWPAEEVWAPEFKAASVDHLMTFVELCDAVLDDAR